MSLEEMLANLSAPPGRCLCKCCGALMLMPSAQELAGKTWIGMCQGCGHVSITDQVGVRDLTKQEAADVRAHEKQFKSLRDKAERLFQAKGYWG